MTGGVGSPGDAVDTGPVVVEAGHRRAGNTHVQNHNLRHTAQERDNTLDRDKEREQQRENRQYQTERGMRQ